MKGAIFSFAIIRPLISPIKAVIVKAVKMGTRMGNSGRFGKKRCEFSSGWLIDATMTAAKPTCRPPARSVPPSKSGNNKPKATISLTEDCVKMSLITRH